MAEMDQQESYLESYIVRIYRREGNSEAQLLGTVEDMQRDSQMKFKTFEELKDILQSRGHLTTEGARKRPKR
jgi:hypothetical protein